MFFVRVRKLPYFDDHNNFPLKFRRTYASHFNFIFPVCRSQNVPLTNRHPHFFSVFLLEKFFLNPCQSFADNMALQLAM
jgi:hypothetical protein